MKKIPSLLVLLLIFNSCIEEKKSSLAEGVWLSELVAMDGVILPFNFKMTKVDGEHYQMEMYNAEEVIIVDEIEIINDSITIKFPVYEGYMAGRFSEKFIEGEFIKESLDRRVPFKATHGINERFRNSHPSKVNVSGVWETTFDQNTEKEYKAKGIFTQRGDRVTGTYRTETGDYRYLDGVVSGDSLKFSAFDGAHAFVFLAKITEDEMNGAFYYGNHSKTPFVAKRNETFELISADSLTFIKEGYDKLSFSFPNSDGEIVSLEDERFKNKVVVVQIMGTWCPNCLDETKYYIDYLNNNYTKDLEFVALAFEYAKSKNGAFKSIKRMKDKLGVDYPILLAQYGSSDKTLAQEKIPMLNHVLSYPTSIFIDKKGNVRKIHTGFNGPATGNKFIKYQRESDQFVQRLIAE